MAAWTSCSATSRGNAEPELQGDDRSPAELTELIWLRFGIWPSCTSSGAVTDDVITSGTGAGIESLHLNGRVIDLRQSGHGQKPEREHADSMIATISNVVATGRRMNGCDGLIAFAHSRMRCLLPDLPGPARSATVDWRPHVDLRAVAQLVGAIDHNAVAWRQSERTSTRSPSVTPSTTLADGDRAVRIDEIYERARTPR